MSTHHGKEGVAKIGGTLIAEVQDFEIEETVDTTADTIKGDQAQTHLVGIPGWSGRITCNWDEEDDMGQGALTIGTSVDLELYPMGDGSGAKYLEGTGSVTRILHRSPLDGKVESEFEVTGNGALDPDAEVAA